MWSCSISLTINNIFGFGLLLNISLFKASEVPVTPASLHIHLHLSPDESSGKTVKNDRHMLEVRWPLAVREVRDRFSLARQVRFIIRGVPGVTQIFPAIPKLMHLALLFLPGCKWTQLGSEKWPLEKTRPEKGLSKSMLTRMWVFSHWKKIEKHLKWKNLMQKPFYKKLTSKNFNGPKFTDFSKDNWFLV